VSEGLADLNEEQRAAVDAKGDVLLLACPGSGKTRTLVHKVASELQKVHSHREFVVALTYTHAAADEIRERVESMGVDTSQLWIGTIHSFCMSWILKPYHVYHPEIASGFDVIDIHDSELLFNEIAPNHPPLKTHYDCKYFASSTGFEFDKHLPARFQGPLRRALAAYHARLAAKNQIDFEMLLKYSYDLIHLHKQLAPRLSKMIRLIAVDEYQDTRDVQYEIISAVARARGSTTQLFIVGDPNQAIYGSLGGVAMDADEIGAAAKRKVSTLRLRNNYRSSQSIVDYYSPFAVNPVGVVAVGSDRDYSSEVVSDVIVSKEQLASRVAELISYSVEALGVNPSEICVVAPRWTQLASMTRSLVHRLPQYQFNGPGLTPFGQNVDNFWYKVARLGLTTASPELFARRLRWAQEVVDEFDAQGCVSGALTARELLRVSNGISATKTSGSAYLEDYFAQLCVAVGAVIGFASELSDQRDSFFRRMADRVRSIKSGEGVDIDDYVTFTRAFSPKSGVTISTIHGVKGAEFDTVIAFSLIEGFVPHYSEPKAQKMESAMKLLYVTASRARKHLYMISETGRGQPWAPGLPTEALELAAGFPFTSNSVQM
jgi:DNA helicase-2/ATP-dependent DNA helicase PcrA